MSNSGRGSPKEPSCKIISKSVQPSWRRSRLKQKVDNARTKDDGQRLITIAHHEHFVLRCAKKIFFFIWVGGGWGEAGVSEFVLLCI